MLRMEGSTTRTEGKRSTTARIRPITTKAVSTVITRKNYTTNVQKQLSNNDTLYPNKRQRPYTSIKKKIPKENPLTSNRVYKTAQLAEAYNAPVPIIQM